jgi:hypothetical protein
MMAIMLDGTKIVNTTAKPASTKVTYKPPTQTKTPNNNYYQQQMAEQRRRQEEARRAAAAQQQAAQNAYAQRMQAMADQARKMQQQQKMPEVGWKQNPDGTWNQQTNTGNYKTPVTNPTPQYGMNMNPGQSQQAQNAYAQRYQQQAQQYGQQNASTTRPYHPVTNPTGYKSGMDYVRTLPNDWREQNAGVLMTPNEWLRRRNAWEKQYGNIFVSETEWQKRNAAAPPGYMWTPFGTGYAKLDTSAQPTAPATDYGGYGDWGYPDYGGGGSTYTPKPPEWWVEMVQWRI